MATSGTINGSCTGGSGGKYNFWAAWQRNGYSVDKCSSNITIDLYVQRNDGYSSSAYNLDKKPSVALKVGGASKTPTTYILDTRNSAKCKIATWTGDVSHNGDGSLTLPIVASFTHSGSSSLTGGSLSGNASITTIPMASSLDSLVCATKYFDGKMTYKYTPKSSSYYNRCNISLNIDGEYTLIKSINIGKKAASQQTASVTLTDGELKTIYDKIPNKPTDKILRFTFRTYSDSAYSDQIGSVSYKDITLSAPENSSTKPSVAITVTPVNSSLPSAFASVFVQGRSKAKVAFTADGEYNATIKSYSANIGGTNYGSPYTSDLLNSPGEITVLGTVTDSRGFTNTATKKINVISYSKPRILSASGEKEIICRRCDENGNYTESGTYLRVKAKKSCATVQKADGTDLNKCRIDFRCKTDSQSWDNVQWKTIHADSDSGNEVDTFNLSKLGIKALSAQTSYVAEIKVTDTVGEYSYTTITIPTEQVYSHEDGARRSFAFGKYVEDDNTFDIAEDINFKVRTENGVATVIGDTGWISLGLNSKVSEGTEKLGDLGDLEIGSGCYYRVLNGNHVYVFFNCSFTRDYENVYVNNNAIPSKYRPNYLVYAINATKGRVLVRSVVTSGGSVLIDFIQNLLSHDTETPKTVDWVYGYIDYFI